MKRRYSILLVATMLLSILSTACSSGKEAIKYEGNSDMKATLTIMTMNQEDAVRRDYGDKFNTKFPNVDIKIVNYFGSNMTKVMEAEKPDVLMLNVQDYEQLIQENKLYDLDSILKNEAFKLDGINPKFLKLLRGVGGGKLYGLPPSFTSEAIYYNKDLFDRYQIPYPQDKMTWQEIIELAKRFPVEDGGSGLYIRNMAVLVENLAASGNLGWYNVRDMKMTINTESYKKIFETVIDAYQSKAVVMPDLEPGNYDDPFVQGTSAMTVEPYYYMNNNLNSAKPFNWDLASAPVNESSRDSYPYNLIDISCINAESTQQQAAWEFIKLVNGEELAKVRSKTSGISPSTRTEYIYNPDGRRLEAFYTLEPQDKRMPADYYALPPDDFFYLLKQVINTELNEVVGGTKTLEEAMASMQMGGQQLLDTKDETP
ncbi:ABC transporter substrate-binding protein [Paenibacillus segetis]|uniref:Sugar ABC transporter substrate-binding protein n=1 Tax=Paenibacillus segetis TaxID=1325360 RepID=A0ABQ1YPZ8_9BACL|nr:extracellular solute-binding protein [Paenibacillus segetis]GGH32698.1 sugar ABC transporter substrate-binding protein [Paenibacillus segetis]